MAAGSASHAVMVVREPSTEVAAIFLCLAGVAPPVANEIVGAGAAAAPGVPSAIRSRHAGWRSALSCRVGSVRARLPAGLRQSHGRGPDQRGGECAGEKSWCISLTCLLADACRYRKANASTANWFGRRQLVRRTVMRAKEAARAQSARPGGTSACTSCPRRCQAPGVMAGRATGYVICVRNLVLRGDSRWQSDRFWPA